MVFDARVLMLGNFTAFLHITLQNGVGLDVIVVKDLYSGLTSEVVHGVFHLEALRQETQLLSYLVTAMARFLLRLIENTLVLIWSLTLSASLIYQHMLRARSIHVSKVVVTSVLS